MDATSTELQHGLIGDLPPSMYYIPNFISGEEESYILDRINPNRWITLSHRRLQAIPAKLTSTNTLISSTGLPTWLARPISDRFRSLGIFAQAPHGGPNHCLINEYLPGQGIMAHEDGAAYFPVVATVSLGGSIVLDVTQKRGLDDEDANPANGSRGAKKSWRILQEPRSLLVTADRAYIETLHGIAEVEEDVHLDSTTVANWDLLGDATSVLDSGGRNKRTTRISLTFRDVWKVSDVGARIFGRTRR